MEKPNWKAQWGKSVLSFFFNAIFGGKNRQGEGGDGTADIESIIDGLWGLKVFF